MRILITVLQSLVLYLVFFIGLSSASRIKRQIIFDTDFNSDCQTPDRRPGRCIRTTSCTELTLTVSRNRLRRYFCGIERDGSRVCCPLSREEITATVRETTRRTTPPTRRPNPGSTVRFIEQPRNSVVTQRPRPGAPTMPPFLPQTCGVSLSTLRRVVGGSKAKKGSWPWMAVVFARRSSGTLLQFCGGSLVTNRHVVTAAHCVVFGRRSELMDPSRIAVRFGAHNLTIPNEPGAVDAEVESIHKHEEFETRTYKNDIAVLKLRTPVTFSQTISPVCLPYDSLRGEDLTNRAVVVIGYGNTANNGNASDVLMQAGFYVQSQDVCKRAYEPEMQFSQVYMCAGTMDGSKDACRGDSGGPLMGIGENNNYYLVGVVSAGSQCGQPRYPGIYTRVTEFLDWLSRYLAD